MPNKRRKQAPRTKWFEMVFRVEVSGSRRVATGQRAEDLVQTILDSHCRRNAGSAHVPTLKGKKSPELIRAFAFSHAEACEAQ